MVEHIVANTYNSIHVLNNNKQQIKMTKVTKKKRAVDPYTKLLTKEQRKKWRQVQADLKEEEEDQPVSAEGDDRFWEQKERELQNKRASHHVSSVPTTWTSDIFNPRRGGALSNEELFEQLRSHVTNRLTPEENKYIEENQKIVKGQKQAFKQAWREGDVLLQGKPGNLHDMTPAEQKAFALALTTMRNGQKEWFDKQNNRSFLETLKEDWLPLITKNQTISNVAKLAAKLVKEIPEGGPEAAAALNAIGEKTDTGQPWLQSIGVTNEGDDTRVPLLGWGMHHRRIRKRVKIVSKSRKH